jgi:hypothetical protein
MLLYSHLKVHMLDTHDCLLLSRHLKVFVNRYIIGIIENTRIRHPILPGQNILVYLLRVGNTKLSGKESFSCSAVPHWIAYVSSKGLNPNRTEYD